MGKVVALMLVLAVAGVASIVAGIYVLAGLAWALIAAGVACIIAAVTLRAGLKNG